MRERLVRRALIEKATQLVPAIPVFPTHHQQILVDSSGEILEHRSIVVFITLGRLVVVPLSRCHAMDLIPPVRFYEVFVSDSLALVMPLQTFYVSGGVFPQGENKFRIRKSPIKFFIEQ